MIDNAEYREHDGIEYIKFDGLPYLMREYVQSKPEYQQSLMIPLDLSCQCGKAYYYPKEQFYKLLEGYK